jgi:hypothetical protein
MKAEKSLIESCKKMDFTFDKAAKIELELFLWIDHSVFENIKEKEGLEKAFEIHMKIWLSWIPDILEEFKREYNINEINSDLTSVMQIIKYYFDTKGCLMKITEINKDGFVGIVDRCPFVENSKEEYNIVNSCEYYNSLFLIEKSFLRYLIDKIVKPNNISFELDKAICNGNKYCRLKVNKSNL